MVSEKRVVEREGEIMALDEEVYRMYNELRYEITQCYKDIAIIDYYRELQKKGSDILREYATLNNHIIRLAQKDLALTIWKITCDGNNDSNTVHKFRKKVNDILDEKGLGNQRAKKTVYKKGAEKLCRMRNEYLAHIDRARKDSRLEIDDLTAILEKACEEFYRLCIVFADEKCPAVTIGEYKWEGYRLSMQLAHLFSNNREVQ